MADVQSALADLLRAKDDPSPREQLGSMLEGTELAAARKLAKDDPASAAAVASVLGRLMLDGVPDADVIDAAKAAAQRAPRDASGNEVALLAGGTIWGLSGQAQLAEPYFRRVRRSDAARKEVLDFYRDLFAEPSAATQLIQVLVQARRSSKDAPARLVLAAEVAQIAEERLQSPDRAIEMWRAVIREDGHDPKASEALERLYRESGKWTALVDLLKDELERIGETADNAAYRIEKLLEIAALYRDRLKLEAMALTTLQRILKIDPRHEASLEALAETYEKAGRTSDLLSVYENRIAAAREAGDTERQIDLLRRVAEIWVEKLGNPQRALEPLATVLELAPKDARARELLAQIHEKRRDFRALIALRREELDEKTGDDALQLRVELARLGEDRLGDRREAIVAWNEVLEHHGDVDLALAALARLYERESRWANAAEILHRKLSYCNRDEAIRLLQHLGGLYTDRLHSTEDAIAVWSELLRLVPRHDKATRRLRDSYIGGRRWDDLTALYEQQGRLADVVEVLQSAADRIGDVDERVALYRRVAGLCQDRLHEPERALKALERTLAIQPDNLEVARELLPIYAEQSNWARTIRTYEVLLRAADSDDDRLDIIAAMQEVAEKKLASPGLTLTWAAEAYRIRPGDARLRERLESSAERADGWDELTQIFEHRIAADGVSDDERLQLLDKLAVIARDRLFKPDDAQRYFRRIITLDPSNSGAMAALEDIYSTTRRWDDLSEVYRKRLEVTEDPDARLETLRGLARIQEDQLSDLEAAVQSYRAVLEIASEDAPALDSLARIYRNRGNWAELADALQRKLDMTTSDTYRVPIMFELAQIHATRLQDSDAAVGGFLSVLELDPGHRDTVAALEELRQSDPSTGLPVMRGLLPYYRRVENRPKEAEAMEVLLAAEDGEERRNELLEQLATTYEKMDDRREDALRIRGELFRADPSQWQGRQTLQRLGGDLGRMGDVSLLYEQVLAQMATEAGEAEAEGRTLPRERAGLRRDLLLEYAAMLRDTLSRPGDAEHAYGEVLEQDETHQGAYEALEALLRGRSASDELVQLYRRRVDVTFNQREQKELLSRITDICRNVLGDRPTAVATAEELLDLIPDDLPTIELLATMYDEGDGADDHAKLEEILGRWAELTGDASHARRLRTRRAALRMQYLGDAYGAVDLLGQVLGEDPDDEEARMLLEELLAIQEVQLQACALLGPIYEGQGDHEGRIRVLHVRRAQAEASGSVDEAVTHLLEIARLREHELGDHETAFEAMREAYLMDPTRFDTREQVERLGVSLGRTEALADVWRAALQHDKVTDQALKIDLTTRLARLLDAHLRDQEQARIAYSSLLALDPPDATLAHEAVAALCRLHLEAGDGVALIDARRQLLRFCDVPEDQVRVRLEIAEIQLELSDRINAALTWSEVLDMQPANVVALEALERLFVEEEEWRRLVEVLGHRIGVTSDPRGRAGLWRRIGEIERDRLNEQQRAIDAFQSVLDLKVGRDDTAHALFGLVQLNEQLERWPDVEESLRRLITIAERDEERVDLLTKTAIIVGQKLGRSADALGHLKRVLDLAPTDPRARSEVASYLEADGNRERAIKILTPLYEAEQNWPALLELEELQARKQPSGRRRLQALLKVANTQEERMGDADKAFAVLCEAMAEAADQPELEDILEKVERLGAEQERAERLLGAYGATVEHILDSTLQQRVLRSQGQVALERLGRLDVARAAYERVLELHPDDASAADALEQIYLRQDDHAPLAGLLVGRADRSTDEHLRDGYLIRGAEIYRTHLDDAEQAIHLYERLSSEGLARGEVQEVIEPLYEATARWRELAAHLNRKLASLAGREAVDTHMRLGRLYGQKLEDTETGIRHLSAALRLDPDLATATEELDRYLEDPAMRARVAELLEPVFAAVADWKRLIQIQEIRLEEAPDDDARMKILLRIAQIEEEQLEDLDRAMKSYERLFKEQPGSRYVRDQLARLCNVLGEIQRYAELLTTYIEGDAAGDESDDTLSIAKEAAELWGGTLRQPQRSVPLWKRLLAARPDDRALFAALEAAMTQAEMWKELAAAYWAETDSALDEDRQLEILRKLATLSQEMLEDNDEASRAYRRMMDLRPDYGLARARLEQILIGTEKFEDLLELLRDNMARTSNPEERNDIARRVAQLQDSKLEDPDGAVDTLEGILADAPDDAGSVSLLEHVAQNRRDHRPRVLAILRPIYERLGNVRRLVEIDEWQLGHTEDPITRHELYREMAELLGRSAESAEAAFRTLCRALAEPGPEEALQGLDSEIERMAELLDAKGGLADALVGAAGAEGLASDIDRRLDLLCRGAALQHELGDPARAAETLRQALELSPEHPSALRQLDAALTRLEHHEELVGVLRKRANVSTDDQDRIALVRRLATLLEEVLARPEEAETAWKQLLDIDPADREALRRLSRVYEASGSTRELIEVLERQIESARGGEERRNLRMQLAALHREALRDRTAEIDVLRTLLSEAEADDDALAALARALIAEERHGEAADVLQERATIAQTDERKAALVLDAARLFSGPIEDVPSAIERYEQVLRLQPGHDGAVGDLVELAKKPDSFEGAGGIVIPELENLGRFEVLAGVLQARSELTSEPEERADALRQLAKISTERLDDFPGALAASTALLDVIDVEGLKEVLEQGGRLAVQLGQGPEHLELLAERAKNGDHSDETRVNTALYAASLAEEILGENRKALEVLVPILDDGLATAKVCERVERLGRATSALPAVEQALRESARLADDAQAQSGYLIKLGEVQLQREDMAGALESFRDAFDLTSDPTAVRGLEQVLEGSEEPSSGLLDALDNAYQASSDRAGQAKIVQHRLRTAADSDQARLLEQLATLREEGGGDVEQALEAWGELLVKEPDSSSATARVLSIGRENPGMMARSVELLLAAADSDEAHGEASTRLRLQASANLLADLDRADDALKTVQAVLEDNAEHPEGLDLLVQASRRAGHAEVLHDALIRSAQIQNEPEKAAALWSEAAQVAETALAQPESAIVDLEQLIAIDESDERAWQKLLSLLTAAADYEKLVEALGRRVMIADSGEERRELRYRLANALVDKLERADDAVSVYQDMLTDQPGDREAMAELEILLRRLERWEDVRDTIERRLEVVADATDRVTVLEELAQLAEARLADPIDAIERYQQIVNEQPGHEAAEAALERLLAAEERWVDLSELLEGRTQRLREAGDDAGYRSSASQLAALLAERLEHPERAEQILGELLEHDPEYVPALLARAAVYESTGNEGAMRLTLERAAALEPEGADGAALHLRLAGLARADLDKRRHHLELALQLDPSHKEVGKELLELCRDQQRWDQVAYLLELVAGRTENADERRELTLERVDIMLSRLSDADGALRVLAPLYRDVQDDVDINRRIADALFSAERHEEAAGMYNWLVEVGRRSKRNKTLAHHLTRLARISLHSEDQNGAKDQLLEAYRIDTTNVETLMTLGALYERDKEWRDALKIYRTMLLQNADQSGLLRRGDIYLNLARAHLALEEKPKARAMLRRGLEEDSGHPEIEGQLAALED